MTQDEIIDMAEKAGLGFVRHASEKDIEKFEHFAKLIASNERDRNDVLEEVAKEIEKMTAFGNDTIASFAQYVREMKE